MSLFNTEKRELCAHYLVCYPRCSLQGQEAILCNQLCHKEKAPVLSLSSFFPFSPYSRAEVLQPSIEESLLSDYEVSLLLQIYNADFHKCKTPAV